MQLFKLKYWNYSVFIIVYSCAFGPKKHTTFEYTNVVGGKQNSYRMVVKKDTFWYITSADTLDVMYRILNDKNNIEYIDTEYVIKPADTIGPYFLQNLKNNKYRIITYDNKKIEYDFNEKGKFFFLNTCNFWSNYYSFYEFQKEEQILLFGKKHDCLILKITYINAIDHKDDNYTLIYWSKKNHAPIIERYYDSRGKLFLELKLSEIKKGRISNFKPLKNPCIK